MKKRFLSIILMLCMLLTLLPTAALADSEIVSGELNEIYAAKTDPSLMPTKADFETGPEWDGVSEPTRQNGNWAQSYAVIDALAEQAPAYADVAPKLTFTLACHEPAASAPGEFLTVCRVSTKAPHASHSRENCTIYFLHTSYYDSLEIRIKLIFENYNIWHY